MRTSTYSLSSSVQAHCFITMIGKYLARCRSLRRSTKLPYKLHLAKPDEAFLPFSTSLVRIFLCGFVVVVVGCGGVVFPRRRRESNSFHCCGTRAFLLLLPFLRGAKYGNSPGRAKWHLQQQKQKRMRTHKRPQERERANGPTTHPQTAVHKGCTT